ncbi:MAG: galactose-1-phosphate uridylyltransferase [Candidatus Omnitrophica bacterium]|nr:galactose-1-phosphate uridylyltransferase [Candidatus Omnitrophota bacterium]MBU2044364.1 galactose-1-phosphate uridylyltransferase [Candidatus Omnitrophota bacterium]MBU2251165.1 galactose-1-phosphate uridylyltransferase [Candidatus Omnitrophota bacterium]MBU2473791.1 galactose-1-phosphate uridylyltransferase [Candidatus Omnitrophota bacterium]
MPELRKDPIIGRWVIIATERAKRPQEFKVSHNSQSPSQDCPFCSGHEEYTPAEISAIREKGAKPNGSGWQVRTVPSIVPLLYSSGELEKRPHGIYDMMNGVGVHEVIVESPRHIASLDELEPSEISQVLEMYRQRILDLEKDIKFKYVLIFKNHGARSGATGSEHSRSQLIALPACPKSVKGELDGAKRYFDYKDRCVYCDMISQEIGDKKRLILDQDGFVAIAPFASRFPFETWILPKNHSADFSKNSDDELYSLAKIFKEVLHKIKITLSDPPYNYMLHIAPYRRPKPGYWSTIDQDYHWHIEIIPRLTQVAGFEWGTGFYINPTPPEEAAKFLREAKDG